MSWVRPAAPVLALLVALLPGCGGGDETPIEPAQRYDLRGEIVAANRDGATLTIDHEEVEGFMSAMIMPFNVRDDWVFDAAEAGARVQATLVIQGASSWIEDVVIIRAPAGGAAAEAVVSRARVGAEVPATPFLDQDRMERDLAEYRGELLLFTFIYTRCPLPDFCPRMSQGFLQIHRAIGAEPERYGDARLVSFTIDPEFDTPEVLRGYGLTYLQEEAGFSRWSFGRPEPEPLAGIATFAGLRFMPEGTEIVHSLRTTLVGRDGRVIEAWVGNAWEPRDLLTALEAAAAGAGD